MSLNKYRDEVGEFLKAIDPKNIEPISKIVKMLDDEYNELKASLDDRNRLGHQVYDILFLLFELAAKENLDLDRQWDLGRDKKKKYIKTEV
jgi:hypothetical protein